LPRELQHAVMLGMDSSRTVERLVQMRQPGVEGFRSEAYLLPGPVDPVSPRHGTIAVITYSG
jgi:hypothetical protein